MGRGRHKRGHLERTKNGRATAQALRDDAVSVVRRARRRAFRVKADEALDPALEALVGRLWLGKRLSDRQYYMARSLANAVRGFVEVAGAPKLVPRISSIYPVAGHAGIPEDIADLIAQHTTRFLRAVANLAPEPKQLVWNVVIEERDVTLTEPEIVMLGEGLDGIIEYLCGKSSR